MRSMYIIQRCEYKGKDKTVGTSIVSDFYPQDYMGSAEFEFGAKPSSLRKMYEEAKSYDIFKIFLLGQTVWVWGNPTNAEDITKQLGDYITDKKRLKEYISLPEILKGEKKSYQRDDFWWDLENHFVFSLDEKAVRDFQLCLVNSIIHMDKK